ncbi:cytidine deaminase [Nocardioides silvaticus]|uniref:Cytidine deaminase n=1 Tax=Nocardioides silvaticus TaxID=2201891 RepID=A0A316T9D2_9ACTN|nr:class I SAM-dependent methyltransferase [Nocardioides silvaticus]PWN00923.1 cytidine deaminase [Nocardioides silvaticus]
MSANPDLPHVVNRAFDVSRRAGYVSFCRNETGRLLAALAATRNGIMAEFGTGCGVGTAWLRSGVRGTQARILTAELDPALARAAAEIFIDDPLVDVLTADWSTLRDKGPYSLLFLDSEQPSEVGVDAIADLVEPGGIVVLDSFWPCEQWPPVVDGRVDILREQWLTDERFTAVEVMVASDSSVVLATRR